MAKRIASPLGDAASRTSGSELNSVRCIASSARRLSIRCPVSHATELSMADNSMTGTFQLNLPKDLLSEAKRAPKSKPEQLRVEGWRNSWLSRISELLVGKD